MISHAWQLPHEFIPKAATVNIIKASIPKQDAEVFALIQLSWLSIVETDHDYLEA